MLSLRAPKARSNPLASRETASHSLSGTSTSLGVGAPEGRVVEGGARRDKVRGKAVRRLHGLARRLKPRATALARRLKSRATSYKVRLRGLWSRRRGFATSNLQPATSQAAQGDFVDGGAVSAGQARRKRCHDLRRPT